MDKGGAKAERGYPGPTRGKISCSVTSRYIRHCCWILFPVGDSDCKCCKINETVMTHRSDRCDACSRRHTGSDQLDIRRSRLDIRRHSCSRRRGISSELHSQPHGAGLKALSHMQLNYGIDDIAASQRTHRDIRGHGFPFSPAN